MNELDLIEHGLDASYGGGGIGLLGAIGGGIIIAYLAILVLIIVSMWKIFVKAGKPGWAAIVPIYNIIIMLEIIGMPL